MRFAGEAPRVHRDESRLQNLVVLHGGWNTSSSARVRKPAGRVGDNVHVLQRRVQLAQRSEVLEKSDKFLKGRRHGPGVLGDVDYNVQSSSSCGQTRRPARETKPAQLRNARLGDPTFD